MTIKRIFSFFLLAIVLLSTTSCFFPEEDPQEKVIGKWYNSDGNYIEIQSDGTVKLFTYELEKDGKLENSVQMGTWAFLVNEKIFKFFLDDSIFEVSMRESDHGSFLNLGDLGSFYKVTEDSRWYMAIDYTRDFDYNTTFIYHENYVDCYFLRSDGQFESRVLFPNEQSRITMPYEYDANGKVQKFTTLYGEILEYTYKQSKDCYIGTSSMTGQGEYFVLTYNKYNQLIKNEKYRNDEIQASTEYTYHKNGNINTTVHITHKTHKFDGLLQLNLASSKYENYTEKTVIERDERGNVTSMRVFVDNELDIKADYEYKNNRLVSRTEEYGLCSDEEKDKYIIVETVIETTENMVKTARYNDGELYDYLHYTYDSFNNLIKCEHYNKENELLYECNYVWSVAP